MIANQHQTFPFSETRGSSHAHEEHLTSIETGYDKSSGDQALSSGPTVTTTSALSDTTLRKQDQTSFQPQVRCIQLLLNNLVSFMAA